MMHDDAEKGKEQTFLVGYYPGPLHLAEKKPTVPK
jgi:hypothetical protein